MKNHPIRGFKGLVGETIKKIDATSINCVSIETESGKVFVIDADEQHCQIAVIKLIAEAKEN